MKKNKTLSFILFGLMILGNVSNTISNPRQAVKAVNYHEINTYIHQIKIQKHEYDDVTGISANMFFHVWLNESDWSTDEIKSEEVTLNTGNSILFNDVTMSDFSSAFATYRYKSIGNNTMSFIVYGVNQTDTEFQNLTIKVNLGAQFPSYRYEKGLIEEPTCYTIDSEQVFTFSEIDDNNCFVYTQNVTYDHLTTDVSEIMIQPASDLKRIHFSLTDADYVEAASWSPVNTVVESFNLNENITFNGENYLLNQEMYWNTNGNNTLGFANTKPILSSTPAEEEYHSLQILIPINTEFPSHVSNSSHTSNRTKYLTEKERLFVFNRAENNMFYYQVPSYDITFKHQGEILFTGKMKYGEIPLGPKMQDFQIEQYEYRFLGWALEEAPETVIADLTVRKEATYVAVYSQNIMEFDIVFADLEGFLFSDLQRLQYGQQPVIPTMNPLPSKEATVQYQYVCDGWCDRKDPEKLVTDFTVKKDVVYIPHFAKVLQKYTVTFHDGETKLAEKTLDYGTDALTIAPAISKKEENGQTYIFKGWSLTKGSSEIIDDLTVRGNATYYAVYVLNEGHAKPIPTETIIIIAVASGVVISGAFALFFILRRRKKHA